MLDKLIEALKNNPPEGGWRSSMLALRTRKGNHCPIAWAVMALDDTRKGQFLNGQAASGAFDVMLGLEPWERCDVIAAADGFADRPTELEVKTMLWEACGVPPVPSEYKPEDAI